MKWYPFDPGKGSKQKRPPVGKWVLGKMLAQKIHEPNPIVACYRNDAAGDKEFPYFVTPGCACFGEVYEWCDCLMGGFDPYPNGMTRIE